MLKKKSLFILLSVFVLLGFAGTMAFAYEKIDKNSQPANVIIDKEKDNIKSRDISAENKKNQDVENFSVNQNTFDDMINLMNEYGYHDMAQYMQENNYEAMHDFMNNLSQEDFDTMVRIMKERGVHPMANMMNSIGREEMISIHENLGQCHGYNGFRNGTMEKGNFKR